MAATKKVILFLVEGITDKTALGLIISKLIKSENVKFELTDGDITTRNNVNRHNCRAKVMEYVNAFLDKIRIQKKDICQIVHLIDTDGAFIPEGAVYASPDGITRYYNNRIESADMNAMLKRNQQKKEITDCLSKTAKLAGIPYQLYYFSRNMEQVLHGKGTTLGSEEKMVLAEAFEDRYTVHPEAFVALVRETDIAVSGEYLKTWKYIEEDLNSLKRKSNLGLFFTK